ncbi:MAG: hypothetical protein IK007_10310 [Lachnospiraceae bacterium]|nr:hypothetical protein [Lachnospiraceae bacterium]
MRDSEKVTYLNIIVDTLKKKEILLNNLKAITLKQAEILDAEDVAADDFDNTIEEKQRSIDALLKLDEGFMDTYERVKADLIANPADYATEISQAKALIKKQTDLSVELQALEEKNKVKLSVQLTKGRQKGRDFRTSSRTAAAYYKNMSNRHQDGDSYFLDSKK